MCLRRLRPVQRAGRVHLPRMPSASGHVGASQPQTCPWGGEGSGAVVFVRFFGSKSWGSKKWNTQHPLVGFRSGISHSVRIPKGPFFVRGFLSHVW